MLFTNYNKKLYRYWFIIQHRRKRALMVNISCGIPWLQMTLKYIFQWALICIGYSHTDTVPGHCHRLHYMNAVQCFVFVSIYNVPHMYSTHRSVQFL